MTAIDVPHVTRVVPGHDGTRIVYDLYDAEPGTPRPTFVLAPGLGAPIVSYRHIIERFADRFRFVTWDPRGLFRSDAPRRGLAALHVADHARDLEAIVAAEGLSRFVLGGWSMAVQISLEYAHHNQRRCEALVLINGSHGNLLRHIALPIPLREKMVVTATRAARPFGFALGATARRLLPRRRFVDLMHRIGLFSANPDFVHEVVAQFGQHDFRRYLGMLVNLNTHSAEPYLQGLTAPALVTAGTRDFMTPPARARALADALPNSRLVLIPDGTHYTPLEFPVALGDALHEFLVGLSPRDPAGAADP